MDLRGLFILPLLSVALFSCGRGDIFGPCEQAYSYHIKTVNHTGQPIVLLTAAFTSSENTEAAEARAIAIESRGDIQELELEAGSTPQYGKLVNNRVCTENAEVFQVSTAPIDSEFSRFRFCRQSNPSDGVGFHIYPLSTPCPPNQAELDPSDR